MPTSHETSIADSKPGVLESPRWSLLVLLVGALTACDSNPGSVLDTTTRRDSAGISIVASSAPHWQRGRQRTIDTVPILDLAGTGGGPMHEFFRISNATRLSNGRVIVANGGSHELRAYAPDGRFLWAAGSEGEGPGEFRILGPVSRFRGDSLLVVDPQLGRITVFDDAGHVGRTTAGKGAPFVIGGLMVLGDSLLAGPTIPFVSLNEMPPGLHRGTTHLVHFSTEDLSPLDTIASYPGGQSFRFARGSMVPLFAKRSVAAPLGTQVVIGTSDAMQYRVYSASGAIEAIFRIPGYDLSLSKEEYDAVLAASLNPNTPSDIREAIDDMPRPETRPAYEQIVADAEGNVWVAKFQSRLDRGKGVDWEVFSPEGAWLGTMHTPPRFHVFEIGEDYVLGRHFTELDVETVQLLRLERHADAPGE